MFMQRIIDSGLTAVHFLSAESIVVVMYLIVWYESENDTQGVKGYEEEPLDIPEPEPQDQDQLPSFSTVQPLFLNVCRYQWLISYLYSEVSD